MVKKNLRIFLSVFLFIIFAFLIYTYFCRAYVKNLFFSFLFKLILAIIITAIIFLSSITIINFVNLYKERRKKKLGIRFKTKLIFLILLISLLPTFTLFLLSLYTTTKSIDIWVDKEIKKSLEDSLKILGDFNNKYKIKEKQSFFLKIEDIKRTITKYNKLALVRTPLKISIIGLFIIFTLLIINISIWVGFRFTNQVYLAVQKLLEGIRKVASGDLNYQVDFKAKDEFRILINSFNKMIKDLKYNKQQLLQSQRIAAWREIAQKLAHEIKNPLTPIKLSIERLHKNYFISSKENYEEILKNSVTVILTEIERLQKLVEEFSLFAKMPSLVLKPVNLNDILKETINLYSNFPNIQIKYINETKLPLIKGDYEKLKQGFINLVENAIDAMYQKGTIEISTKNNWKDNEKVVKIEIEDNGEGIPFEVQEKIFFPYFSTKQKGKGLGLSVVKQIIEEHKGTIDVESKVGQGTKVIVQLPVLK